MTKGSLTEGALGPPPSADAALAADPLPSWNDGPTKQSILSFVEKVTMEGSPSFVPVPERIATFDNDGTLWCETPVPVQVYFALDRVKALVSQHPEWKTTEPFASLLKGDLQATLAGGDHALLELLMATHTGMTTVEFEQIVKDETKDVLLEVREPCAWDHPLGWHLWMAFVVFVAGIHEGASPVLLPGYITQVSYPLAKGRGKI